MPVAPHIFDRKQIERALEGLDPVGLIEQGFVAYSEGRVVVPPVGELLFDQPPGEVHIKYGYIRGEEYYVIKIASGFYENPKRNLPSTLGLLLVFRQQTGELAALLLDDGHLTNVRTAAAGAVVARHLAPKNVRCIGVLGTGVQARMQVEYLRGIVDCREVCVWGRSEESLDAYRAHLEPQGYNVQATRDPKEVAACSILIVTATPSTTPLLAAESIQLGTHITAMGSDTTEKIELDPAVLAKADLVVADSIEQSQTRGEVFQARKAGVLSDEKVHELGNIIAGKAPARTSDEQISVADLTGVAVQDIQISKAVLEALLP
jgi:ornithine cyclodeaminase